MMINLGCGYRIRRFDARNWTIDQLRAPDPSSHFTKGTAPKWHHLGVYFGTLDYGLRWCYEHELLASDPAAELSLMEAMDRAEQIAEGLAGAIGLIDGPVGDVAEDPGSEDAAPGEPAIDDGGEGIG